MGYKSYFFNFLTLNPVKHVKENEKILNFTTKNSKL